MSILFLLNTFLCIAASPKREFRATWIATHYRIDWPRTVITNPSSTTQINRQKSELCAILDTLKAGNLNAVMFQVRPTADAFYQSSYEPWSKNLTDVRGLYPGYDPLQFAIEEAHKRGMELHAWVNPFRYEVTAGSYGNADIRAAHPDWLLTYSNGSYNGTILDPGQPVVRQYVTNVIMEMVNNYDIDGMIWDDYFYPYGGTTTEDAVSKLAYKPADMSDGDWRRQNVNQTIEMIYDSIQQVKPWVRFGMAPFGIWTTKSAVAASYGISLPQGITGLDDYNVQFCDPMAWIRGGYIDYISPQLYWPTTSSGQDYDVLSKWWCDMTKHFSDQLPSDRRVHFYSSNNDYSDWVTASEEAAQVRDNRQFAPYDAPGAIFYNTNQYKAKGLIMALKNSVFTERAIVPAMDWKPAATQPAPAELTLTGNILTWTHPAEDMRFSVYVYNKGYDPGFVQGKSTSLYDIVWEKQIDLARVGDLSQKSIIVCALDRFGNEFAPAYFNRADEEIIDTIAIHVTGLTMRLKEADLRVGASIGLNPVIKPNNASCKTILYESSNPEVAMVFDNGVVYGLSNGDATITCTTLDGGYQVSCTIHVFGGTGLDEVPADSRATLLMRDGHIYILRDGRIYSITGQPVE